MQYGPKVHINNTDETIKPTVDSENENDALPFLDCLIKRNTDSSLETTLHGKRKNTGRFISHKARAVSEERKDYAEQETFLKLKWKDAIQSYCCSW